MKTYHFCPLSLEDIWPNCNGAMKTYLSFLFVLCLRGQLTSKIIMLLWNITSPTSCHLSERTADLLRTWNLPLLPFCPLYERTTDLLRTCNLPLLPSCPLSQRTADLLRTYNIPLLPSCPLSERTADLFRIWCSITTTGTSLYFQIQSEIIRNLFTLILYLQ